jgi:hypothetical protein
MQVCVSLAGYFEAFDRIDEERRRLLMEKSQMRTALQNCLGISRQVQSNGFARMAKCRSV